MSQNENILEQLRDIQLPPAPESVSAWLILANLLMLLACLAGLYHLWRHKRELWRRDALHQLGKAGTLEPTVALLALARLLRQIMLYRQYDINTNGQNWLAKLDEAFDTQWFTQAEGQVFGSALYRQNTVTEQELQLVCQHLERLIKSLPARTQAKDLQPERPSTL